MKIKNMLLTFDLEEYEKGGEKAFDVGLKGGEVVRDLLERMGVNATFFVTASFYARFPDFVVELAGTHEIAFHGLEHDDDYRTLPGDVALKKLREGKESIEKGLRMKMEGFRAPRMRPPSYRVLREAGFSYSSSLHPTYVPGRYNNFRSPRSPFAREEVVEIPVSVSPLVRLPVSWVWFRQLGVSYAKVVTQMLEGYLCMYFHPWEFTPVEGGILYSRNTGKHVEHALEEFLGWICPQVECVTMGEFVERWKELNSASLGNSGG